MRLPKRQPVLLYSTIMAFFLLVNLLLISTTAATTRLTQVSNTISTSVAGVGANHNYSFTLQQAVPLSGKIIITPEGGQFIIPSAMNSSDISTLVNGVPASMGIAITSGSSGNITLTQTSSGLSGGDVISVSVGGTHQITNPSAVRSYSIDITTTTSGGTTIDYGQARIAIVDSVRVSGDNTTTTPPPPPGGGGGGGTQTDLTIDPAVGGAIVHSHTNGSSLNLTLPIGFWSLPTVFRITDLSSSMAESLAPFPGNKILAEDHVNSILGVDSANATVIQLLQPATLQYHYTSDVASRIYETTIKVYTLTNPSTGWQELPGVTIDQSAKTVTVSTKHFSLFAILADPKPVVTPPGPTSDCPNRRIGDLNCDSRVDLVDFSILLYNWGVPKNPIADLNNDGQVDLVDFSILLYWWTG